MSNSPTKPDTTGKTLSGDTLTPEEDPHTPDTDDQFTDNNSIYPIEAEFKIEPTFTESGYNPFMINILILIPFGVNSIPSSRTEKAREDIRKIIDYDNPKIGKRGKITFAEQDHTIKLYSEEDTTLITLGEWIFKQFYYMLNETITANFTDANIPAEDIATIQTIIQKHLPGKFITVEGTCSNCDTDICKEVYTSQNLNKGFVMCDCGHGTNYPQQ